MSVAAKGRFGAVLKRKKEPSPSCRLLVFERPAGFPDALPGQFVSLRAGCGTAPLLRRPYSIMDLTRTTLTLLVKIVGRGSALLADTRPGETVDMIGPLGGIGFPEPAGEDAVLVAGGTGLAPLFFAARAWRRKRLPSRTTLIYGAGTEGELLRDLAERAFSTCRFATLDGSAGYRGDVVALCRDLIANERIPGGVLYSCGPRAMVSALVEAAGARFLEHYTSLESIMACGVGACRGCTVPVRGESGSELRAICSDGTVFRAADVAWEEWEE